jgi:hypothetical protein
VSNEIAGTLPYEQENQPKRNIKAIKIGRVGTKTNGLEPAIPAISKLGAKNIKHMIKKIFYAKTQSIVLRINATYRIFSVFG